MDLEAWLSVVQTVALIATAAIVYWYTRETVLIRRETQRQNAIQARHLQILEASEARAADEAHRLTQPEFVEAGGSFHAEGGELKLRNTGAPIDDLYVRAPVQSSVHPRARLAADQVLTVKYAHTRDAAPEPIPFDLTFTDQLGVIRQVRLTYSTARRAWTFHSPPREG